MAQTFINDHNTVDKVANYLESLDFKVSIRPVPVSNNIKSHPNIVQFVVSKNIPFDTFLLRNQIESNFDAYVCSLDAKTIVYKALSNPTQLFDFYKDFKDIDTRFAISHVRYSTNTSPKWHLAQPFRNIAHNGEINTLNTNIRHFKSLLNELKLKDQFVPHFPYSDYSDSAVLDTVIDYYLNQRHFSIQDLFLMVIPKQWQHENSKEIKQLYHHFSKILTPFEGPVALLASDGTSLVATVDKSGLRPCRYMVANDGTIIISSEFMDLGMSIKHHLPINPAECLSIDIKSGEITNYNKILSNAIKQHKTEPIPSIPTTATPFTYDKSILNKFQYTFEEKEYLLNPMTNNGSEPLGSMGTDTPLAYLSKKPQLLYNYFHQSFAQVFNPSIDPIRESLMMSLGVLPPITSNLPLNDPLVIKSFQPITNYNLESYLILHRLQGGCQVPIAAHATVTGTRVRLEGLVASVDGKELIRDTVEGHD